MKKILLRSIVLISLSCGSLLAQEIKEPLLSPIKKGELKQDVYELADNHFLGREAGTINEFKGAVWLAERMRQAGIEPAGDDGTYYQFFDLYFRRQAESNSLTIGERSFKQWTDFIPTSLYPSKLKDLEIEFVGTASPEELSKRSFKGKVVAVEASLDGIFQDISLFHKRFYYLIQHRYKTVLGQQGAEAVIFVANDLFEDNWDAMRHEMMRGRNGIKGIRDKVLPELPTIWLHKKELSLVQDKKNKFSCDFDVNLYTYPSVNLVGKIEGTDPKLKHEYVLISSHHDHVGVREVVDGDSIINGADDNASMCAAALGVARSFKQQPAKRSTLFVFHGAEEMSLLGSRYFVRHPVVPKENIVCVLNGDLIGRNSLDSAALLGAWGKHRTSDELVEAAMEANEEGPKFKLDKTWDDPMHPEFFFLRSDHVPYARAGIPVLFYTSMLHDEYHTPKDKPERMNYDKLHKMTEWIYRTAWKVANMPERPKYLPNVHID